MIKTFFTKFTSENLKYVRKTVQMSGNADIPKPSYVF